MTCLHTIIWFQRSRRVWVSQKSAKCGMYSYKRRVEMKHSIIIQLQGGVELFRLIRANAEPVKLNLLWSTVIRPPKHVCISWFHCKRPFDWCFLIFEGWEKAILGQSLLSPPASTSCETKLSVLSPKRMVTEWPPEDVLKKSQPPPDWWKMRWICHWTPSTQPPPPFFILLCPPWDHPPSYQQSATGRGVQDRQRGVGALPL